MHRAKFGRGLVTSCKIAFPVTQRMTVHPLIFSFVIINLSSVSRAPFFFGFTNFMLRLIAVSILRWRFISAFSLFLFAPPHILSHWLEPGGQSNFRVLGNFFFPLLIPICFFTVSAAPLICVVLFKVHLRSPFSPPRLKNWDVGLEERKPHLGSRCDLLPPFFFTGHLTDNIRDSVGFSANRVIIGFIRAQVLGEARILQRIQPFPFSSSLQPFARADFPICSKTPLKRHFLFSPFSCSVMQMLPHFPQLSTADDHNGNGVSRSRVIRCALVENVDLSRNGCDSEVAWSKRKEKKG